MAIAYLDDTVRSKAPSGTPYLSTRFGFFSTIYQYKT